MELPAYITDASPGTQTQLDLLADEMRGRRFAVLTGAGMSTESGIPDYRGPGKVARRRRTIWYRDFVSDVDARRRYWARSTVGWPKMRSARPNRAHGALARIEQAGYVAGIITQNVDRLHQAAGSRKLIELHGSLERVVCLSCGTSITRDVMQQRLLDINPFLSPAVAEPLPDGDADLEERYVGRIRVPNCGSCGGVLKPDVVFFGENVPAERVKRARGLVENAEGLLVLGSSLTVYSGYRFAALAAKRGVPLAIVAIGPTRADDDAKVKIDGRLGNVLPGLADILAGSLEPNSAAPPSDGM